MIEYPAQATDNGPNPAIFWLREILGWPVFEVGRFPHAAECRPQPIDMLNRITIDAATDPVSQAISNGCPLQVVWLSSPSATRALLSPEADSRALCVIHVLPPSPQGRRAFQSALPSRTGHGHRPAARP